MVIEIQCMDDFNQYVKGSGDKLVVVDFTATWCGPCKQISPVFDTLAGLPENKNVVFLKVDVDDAADVSENCEISCMPTFHFYKNGEKVFEFSGCQKTLLAEKVKELRTQ
ncbi:thioredoxin b [Nelusetta ayraudi]|uniref:thioredoxin b n=1 Tax=Nelusetta ayraudi TaxID=303726 RepID=UPI003F7041A9